MGIRGFVGRGVIIVLICSVGIQGFKIQVEPMREVHDKVKRKALVLTILISYCCVRGGGRDSRGLVGTVALAKPLLASEGYHYQVR